MKDLIIYEDEWLYGENAARENGGSYLLRSKDKLKCCLGFYLLSIGFPENVINNHQMPNQVYESLQNDTNYPLFPSWLLVETSSIDKISINSNDCVNLMITNDAIDMPIEDIKSTVQQIFAEHGINVIFLPTRSIADANQ